MILARFRAEETNAQGCAVTLSLDCDRADSMLLRGQVSAKAEKRHRCPARSCWERESR